MKFGNGPSLYQNELNDGLTGALGPTNTAYWTNTDTTSGNPWSLGAQPLYYSPSAGYYVTSFDQNVAPENIVAVSPDSFGTLGKIGTWNPSVAFGRRGFSKGPKKGRKGSCKGRKGSRKGSRKGRKARKGSRKCAVCKCAVCKCNRKRSRFGCGCNGQLPLMFGNTVCRI